MSIIPQQREPVHTPPVLTGELVHLHTRTPARVHTCTPDCVHTRRVIDVHATLRPAPAERRQTRRARRRAVLIGAAVADVPVLGTAGYLAGHADQGQTLAVLAAALVLPALGFGAFWLIEALTEGAVHCPGCPR